MKQLTLEELQTLQARLISKEAEAFVVVDGQSFSVDSAVAHEIKFMTTAEEESQELEIAVVMLVLGHLTVSYLPKPKYTIKHANEDGYIDWFYAMDLDEIQISTVFEGFFLPITYLHKCG